MDKKYIRNSKNAKLGHFVEECGEVLSAVGKTIRWGLDSFNPELPTKEKETNRKWIKRELQDLKFAITRLEEML